MRGKTRCGARGRKEEAAEEGKRADQDVGDLGHEGRACGLGLLCCQVSAAADAVDHPFVSVFYEAAVHPSLPFPDSLPPRSINLDGYEQKKHGRQSPGDVLWREMKQKQGNTTGRDTDEGSQGRLGSRRRVGGEGEHTTLSTKLLESMAARSRSSISICSSSQPSFGSLLWDLPHCPTAAQSATSWLRK